MHDICKGGVSIQLTLRELLGLCGGMSSTECHSLTHSLRLFHIYVSDVTDLGRKRGKEERCDMQQKRLGCCCFMVLYVSDPPSHEAPTKLACLNTDHLFNNFCGSATRLRKELAKKKTKKLAEKGKSRFAYSF